MRRFWPVLLLFVLALGAFVTYRAYATRWTPPVVAAAAPQVTLTRVPFAPTLAPNKPAVTRYSARYDSQGTLLDVRDQNGRSVAPGSQPAFPAALDKTVQGVSLADAAQALAGLSVLEGAIYDPARRQLALIGAPGAAAFEPDDLRVALADVFAGNDAGPAVSIDPGPTVGTMTVRFTGPVTNTHFGQVLFEADRLMKTLGLGQDNLTRQPVSATVPGYQTHLDLIVRLEGDKPSNAQPTWHRFWFVPTDMKVGLSANGRAMRFIDASLKVENECLDEYLKPLPGCRAPAADAFAAHLTAHYDEYAAQFPILRQLKELGKLVSLAKWLRDQKIPLDLAWLNARGRAAVETPFTTPALTVTREISATPTTATGTLTIIRTYSLYGGVKFQFENQYQSVPSTGPVVETVALGARPSADTAAWAFTAGNQELRAVALSLEEEARIGVWPAQATTDLALAPVAGLPVGVIRYPAVGSDVFGPGWRLDDWRLAFPRPEKLYHSSAGAQAELVPPVVVWTRRRTGEQRIFEFQGWDSRGVRVFTRAGGAAAERITWTRDGGYVREVADGIQQQFDDLGRLVRLTDTGGRWARYGYEGAELRRIECESGATLTFSYSAGQLAEVTSNEGKRRRYIYDAAGRLIRITDEQGKALVEYEYDAEGRLLFERDGEGQVRRRNSYDLAGRLTSFQQGGAEFSIRPTGTGYEIIYERAETRPTAAPARVEVNILAARLPEAQRKDATWMSQIRAALESLDGAQLADLNALAARPDAALSVELVDEGDMAFLTGDARKLLPGTAPFAPKLYQVDDRWLMAFVDNADAAPNRADVVGRLLRYRRLQQQVPDSAVVYVQNAGNSLRIMAGGQAAEIAPAELETFGNRLLRMFDFLPFVRNRAATTIEQLALAHPERLGQALLRRQVISKNRPIIGFDGDLLALNFRQVLRQQHVWRTYGTDVEGILRRVQYQQGLTMSVGDVVFFNGAPADIAGLKAIGKDKDRPEVWRAIHDQWSSTAKKNGAEERPAGERALIDALKSKPQVMVLVAHSDGIAIYFPDGSSFRKASLTPDDMEQIRANGPIVILFGCETGSIVGTEALAQTLLEAGAQGVIAPTGEIGAATSVQVLEHFLEGMQKGWSFLDALWDALRGSDLQNYIGRQPSDDREASRWIG
ncbi:MAG: hypothetical protein NT169_21430 [Chloroflexi bacterium]|nr:hypothetical protein [Chloroflexota bacterium]